MAKERAIDPQDLLSWDGEGVSTADMRTKLAEGGQQVSIELVRLRLREARRGSAGSPPAAPKVRKDSATAARLRLLAEATEKLEQLRDGLDAAVDAWGDTFSTTERFQRWSDAAETLGEVLNELTELDVSW